MLSNQNKITSKKPINAEKKRKIKPNNIHYKTANCKKQKAINGNTETIAQLMKHKHNTIGINEATACK